MTRISTAQRYSQPFLQSMGTALKSVKQHKVLGVAALVSVVAAGIYYYTKRTKIQSKTLSDNPEQQDREAGMQDRDVHVVLEGNLFNLQTDTEPSVDGEYEEPLTPDSAFADIGMCEGESTRSPPPRNSYATQELVSDLK